MVTNYQNDSIIGRLDTETNEIEEGANGFAGVIDKLAQGPPVAEGLNVTANYTDLTATVDPGVAVVRPGDGTAFLAQFSGADVSLSGASVNEVYLTADPDASATAVAVDVRDDGTTPSLPHVRLATCDATTNTTTPRNRTRGDDEFDKITTEEAVVRGETLVIAGISAEQSISTGSLVDVPFDTEIKDERGEFDTSTNTLTVDKDGYYHVSASAKLTANASGDSLLMQFYDSDATNVKMDKRLTSNSAGDKTLDRTRLIELSAGTNYQIRVRNNDSNSAINPEDTYLTVRSALRFL